MWTVTLMIWCAVASSMARSSDAAPEPAEDIDRAMTVGAWATLEDPYTVGVHLTKQFDVSKVADPSHYSLTGCRTGGGIAGPKIANVTYRWRVLSAPLRVKELVFVYRAYLHLETSLPPPNPTCQLTVKLDAAVANTTAGYELPLVATEESINTNIRVNQVGYLPTDRKLAFISQWYGAAPGLKTQSGLTLAQLDFSVINVASGATVMSGVGRDQTAHAVGNESTAAYTGSAVYELNFTSVTEAGTYQIVVPGMGRSWPFHVKSTVYDVVLGAQFSGMYHARCGLALTPALTRWHRPIDHYRDGVILPTNPAPAWFMKEIDQQPVKEGRAFYSSAAEGTFQNATHGHHDAGDYGKYTTNGATAAFNLLIALDAMPQQAGRDDLGIPESGNGVPDVADEAKWELDWLEGMQDADGGAFCIVKPNNTWYQGGMPNDPGNDNDGLDRMLLPKDTSCTLRLAAAMATAASSAVMKKHFPADAARYLNRAQRAFAWSEANPNPLCYHFYGCNHTVAGDSCDPGGHGPCDAVLSSRVWAALAMWLATGNETLHEYVIANHQPGYRQWGWGLYPDAWGTINLQYLFSAAKHPSRTTNPALLQKVKNEVLSGAELLASRSEAMPHRLGLQRDPLHFQSLGWWFPQVHAWYLGAGALLAAAEGDSANAARYRESAISQWDWTLGANPSGWLYTTGLGKQRFRTIVDQDSEHDGIEDPVPGISKGLTFATYYVNLYGKEQGYEYPDGSAGELPMPLLTRAYDGFSVDAEATVHEHTLAILGAMFLATPAGASLEPSAPTALKLLANVTVGSVPLAVSFTAAPADASASPLVDVRWDFDDRAHGNSATTLTATKTFMSPFAFHDVACVAWNERGRLSWANVTIGTQPAIDAWPFRNTPFSTDAQTVQLWHFDSGDWSSAEGLALVPRGDPPTLDSSNLLWMLHPAGAAARFSGPESSANVSVLYNATALGPEAAITLEAKFFVEEWPASGIDNFHCLALTFDWDASIGLNAPKYGNRSSVNVGAATIAGQEALTDLWDSSPPRWVSLVMTANATTSTVSLDGKLVAAAAVPNPFIKKPPRDGLLMLEVGHFTGLLDELRISTSVR